MARRRVFLFVPNIIGYARIILLGLSFYHMIRSHRLGMMLYLASNALDAVDGLAARMLNQSSILGSMLDMLTDRISTMCLLVTLSHLYSGYFQIILLLLSIDITSHWLHFFAAKLRGAESHKYSPDIDMNSMMKLYYGNKLVLTSVCGSEQIFYGSALMAHFEPNSYFIYIASVCLPGLIFKNWINLLQIYHSSKSIASLDESAHVA